MTFGFWVRWAVLCGLVVGACACGEDSERNGQGNDPEPEADAVGDTTEDEEGDSPDAEPDVPDMPDPPEPAPDQTLEVAGVTVEIESAAGVVRILDPDGAVLLETVGSQDIDGPAEADRLGGYAPAAWRHTALEVENLAGAFAFDRLDGQWQRYTTVTAIESGSDGVTIDWEGPGIAAAQMTLAPDERGNLLVRWRGPQAAPEGKEVLSSLSFKCQPEERFYGLGSQSFASEHRGWRVPMWTREQGIGKREGGGVFAFNGALEDAYAPMGWLMSSRGYGVLLDRAERSVFELCSERDDAWRLETFAQEVGFVLMLAPEPKAMLGKLTEYTGRTRVPVPWTFAPWNDGLRSEERVRALTTLLRDNGIPSSVMWVEDWIGGEDEGITGYHLNYVWFADEERWPNLEGLIGDLRADGFEFLGYFNSFVRKNSRLWQEGLDGDFLIKNDAGEPYEFIDPIFEDASLVDLTNPEARNWLKSYQHQAVELGMRGWMADFGEWLPYDAVLSDGRRGSQVHNLYPLMWQEANLENLTEALPDGDFTFFARSGFAWTGGGTAGLAPVVWAGDQNTTWDDSDGIKTVVSIGVNLGMSGVGIFAHDIAGYTSAVNPTTTRELFWRWTEMGAFTPVMRTHHGAMDLENWSLDRDEETLAHWKRYAIEHTLLYPYLMSLGVEASQTGVPMFRHMVLEFPKDEAAARLKLQYMLGPSLLVAPVMDEGAQEVEVYLPEGRWVSWWGGEGLEGPGMHTVAAPLGTIPVFVRQGAIVPRLVEVPDTLTGAAQGVKTLADVEGVLELRLHGGAEGSFELADGTTFALGAQDFAQDWAERPVSVGGQALAPCQDDEELDCVDVPGRQVRVSGALLEVVFDGGPVLSISSEQGRRYVLSVMAP